MGLFTLKLKLFVHGYGWWPSRSGFGITTSWPDRKCVKEIERIKALFKKHLPDDWISDGPVFASGGCYVMYAWPRSDAPKLKRRPVASYRS